MKKTITWNVVGRRAGKIVWSVVRFLLLFGLGYTLLSPFISMLSVAFRAEEDIWNPSVVWITRHFTTEHLSSVMETMDYWNTFARTMLIAVFSAGPLRASLNVSGFFAGMLLGYYWYTTVLFGFFPRRYATVWIIIAAAASALAWLIWYARGSGWFPAFISAIIIGFFITQAFSFGMWYVDLREFPELFLLFASSAVLYRKPKQFLYAVLGGVLFAPVLSALFPYVFGGL